MKSPGRALTPSIGEIHIILAGKVCLELADEIHVVTEEDPLPGCDYSDRPFTNGEHGCTIKGPRKVHPVESHTPKKDPMKVKMESKDTADSGIHLPEFRPGNSYVRDIYRIKELAPEATHYE